MIAGVVAFKSPYAPIVEPVRAIEELWEIEDTRQESEMPLVTSLENHGVPLAYDMEENTFYCAIGIDNGEAWPDIHLTAPEGADISICFSDDYEYDSCEEAIEQGYSYELMAYTDTEYCYFYIVFTGLPILTIRTDQEITMEDTAAYLTYNHPKQGNVESYSRVHWRGDGTLSAEKKSMKLETTRRRDGSGKTAINIPGMGVTDEVVLLAMYYDPMLMRDRLSWDMASLIIDESKPFSARKTEYVEVFINDVYWGVYLILKPYDISTELTRMSNHAVYSDSLYRTFFTEKAKDKPYYTVFEGAGAGYELMYTQNSQKPFLGLMDYIDLINEKDNEEFAKKAEKYIDLDSALEYVLLLQSMIMQDNTVNNLYIWDHHGVNEKKYRFAIWDLDQTWDCHVSYNSSWFALRPHDRIINQNIGNARKKLEEKWSNMKKLGYTKEKVVEFVRLYEMELSLSGAFARNQYRWGGEYGYPNGGDIISYAVNRFDIMDVIINYIANNDATMGFLDDNIRGDVYEVELLPYLEKLGAW